MNGMVRTAVIAAGFVMTAEGASAMGIIALFEDPHKSQELRQSPDSDDESFWLRWKEYGAHAERLCS